MHLFHIPKPCWPLLSQWSGGCRIPQLSVWEQKPSLRGSPLKCQVVGVTLSWRKGLSVVPLPNLPEEYMPQDCIHPLGNTGHADYSNSFSIHCEVRKNVTGDSEILQKGQGHRIWMYTLCPAAAKGHGQSWLNCASFQERLMWWKWNCSLHHFSVVDLHFVLVWGTENPYLDSSPLIKGFCYLNHVKSGFPRRYGG